MALKVIKGGTVAGGRRKLPSWIDRFVKSTDNLGTPKIFRLWSAIATIGAVLEQKVWAHTSGRIYPNLYIFLIGPPGAGKTLSVQRARQYIDELDPFMAPTNMTAASLLDSLSEHHRIKPRLPEEALDYHCMALFNDDWQTLMTKQDDDIVALLTQFYDAWPYHHTRRTSKINIKMASPLLSIIAGTTPADLLSRMPDHAWGAGFTSRSIFVFSDKQFDTHPLDHKSGALDQDLIDDLKLINEVVGELKWSGEFYDRIEEWRQRKYEPSPTHPRLLHYNSRRPVHLIKLAMVRAIDRGGDMVLSSGDFDAAYDWLTETELKMIDVFDKGSYVIDELVMDEAVEYVKRTNGTGMPEGTLYRKVSRTIGVTKVRYMIDVLVQAKRLKKIGKKFFAED